MMRCWSIVQIFWQTLAPLRSSLQHYFVKRSGKKLNAMPLLEWVNIPNVIHYTLYINGIENTYLGKVSFSALFWGFGSFIAS